MKKISTFLFLLIAFVACKTTVPTGVEPGGSIAVGASAEYHYLNYMYNPSRGESYANNAMSGAIFQRYAEYIKPLLNGKLQFPVRTSTDTSIAEIWYKSIPSSLMTYVNQAGGNIADGLSNFFKSQDGQNYIQNTLNNIDAYLKSLIDYSIAKLGEQFAGDIQFFKDIAGNIEVAAFIMAGSLAVNAITGVVNAITTTVTQAGNMVGTIATNLMSSFPFIGMGLQVASMFMSSSQHAEVMKALRQIQASLQRIEEKLEKMDKKLDLIVLTVIKLDLDQCRKSISDSLIKLDTIYEFIESLVTKPQLLTNYINNLIVNNDDYQHEIQNVWTNSEQYQSKIVEYTEQGLNDPGLNIKLLTLVKMPDVSVNYSIPGGIMCGPVTVNIDGFPDPRFFVNRSYSDILALKRLSLSRLELLVKANSGNELLKNRAIYAGRDLIKVQEIKIFINTLMQTNITNYIKNNWLARFNLKIYNALNNWAYSACYNGSGVSPQCISYNLTTRAAQFPKAFLIKNYSTDFSYDTSTKKLTSDNMNTIVENLLNLILDTPEYKLFLSLYAAELADWEVKLQAHIDAGAGL